MILSGVLNRNWLCVSILRQIYRQQINFATMTHLESRRIRRSSIISFISFVIFFVLQFNPQRAAAQFQAADSIVGNEAGGYADHEFSSDSVSVSWMGAFAPYRLWQAPMNRATGNIGFSLAVQLDSNLVPFQQILQGTDWSSSQQGSWVYYTKRDANIRKQVFKARATAAQQVVTEQLTTSDTAEKFNPLPSRDAADLDARFLFLIKGDQSPLTYFWRESNNPLTEAPLPSTQLSSSGARWINGSRALIYADSIAGYDQEFRFDVDDQKITQLTFSPIDKTDGFFFDAPEYGEELFFCTEGNTSLGIYRKNAGGGYDKFNSLVFPSARSYVFSAEPFAFAGKSYVFAVVSDSGFMSNADVWIAAVNPDTPFYRQVSGSDPMLKRMDPEVYLTETDAIIYYFEWENFRLHRCETGLAALSSVTAQSNTPKSFSLAQNYPNPFNPNTVISYQLSIGSEVRLKVFDVLGREIATLVNAKQAAGTYKVSFNAGNFPSGIYFYSLRASGSDGRSGNFMETKKMMLVK